LEYLSIIEFTEISWNEYGVAGNYNPITYANFFNCTFSNQLDNFDMDTPSYLKNCIIWNGGYDLDYAIVTYSNIEGGCDGIGNIDEDPKFCTYEGYEYHLLEGSPCIDTGDPAFSDDDGTRIDMGCYPSTTDLKLLKGRKHSWISCPRMLTNPRYGHLHLGEMISMPRSMELIYAYPPSLIYNMPWWSSETYNIFSDRGYKLYPDEDREFLLPAEGDRLPADHTIEVTFGDGNWIGYWLPYTQKWVDALGDQLDDINCIQGEDWYVFKVGGQWYGFGTTEEINFVYGKGYIMWVDQTFDLQWIDSGNRTEEYKKPDTEFFTYEDKPNYEMIEIESIEGGEEILEIGVFQGDVCVGASVVEEYPVHIMSYTDAINRDDELSFELYSSRSEVQTFKTVLKYNFSSGEYERTVLQPFADDFSLIKLVCKDIELPEETEKINSLTLASYPNPFTRNTTISYSLPDDSKANIYVYNLKGQKVKTLVKGDMTEGEHQTVWDATDENNKPVSSGIYMYRLETPHKTINRKLLLMR